MIDWNVIYQKFLEKYDNQSFLDGQYSERHHIIPKHSGGTNIKSNLIRLSIRQHCLAHFILFRMNGHLGDKLAYLMKSGQTDEGNKLRVQLSLATGRDEFIRKSRECNCMKNPETVLLAITTKRLRYNGNCHSEAGLAAIRISSQISFSNPESKSKAIETRIVNNKSLTPEQRKARYARNGQENGNFGTVRPGEQAGNYGKSKGIYTFISPDGEKIIFNGIRKAMSYFDVCDGIINKYTNIGVIGRNKYKTNRFVGWQIIFVKNDNYGKDHQNKLEKFKIWHL